MNKKSVFLIATLLGATSLAKAVELTKCTIVASENDAPLVHKMAEVMSRDIEMVTGVRAHVADAAWLKKNSAKNGKLGGAAKDASDEIVLATVDGLRDLGLDGAVDVAAIRGGWERFAIVTKGKRMVIVGSDARGLAYGVFHVSEKIGVSPWYWWADVPVEKKAKIDYKENYVSKTPSVRYRGFFINDEDWGLKTWSSRNYEKALGDIGPETYDKVCELVLRLKGNMLAPAMHSCTGAFYSHPESQKRAAEWGVMITTSHCEPLLFNNASKFEWDKKRDGEWNYLTNKETIYRKLDDRIKSTAQYDNIYTMGMRGLHDEAMKGSNDPKVRARTLETVFSDQRGILERWKKKNAADIPQIFVPYKETLDIYDAGLKVPDDITLVWPDDNYGYMKRVSNDAERKRSGGSGVYYHLSYLGTPHDYLWISSTAPVLMYEELKKAYDAGADRYWLLNVGDIKPMEMETQQFFDMAWDMDSFSYDNVNKCQASWLASIFGSEYKKDFQDMLDTYYRLAWERKPEFMGYEIQWDSKDNERQHDSHFSFADGTAQKRLADYKRISDMAETVMQKLDADHRPAFFELAGFAVQSACQMNCKFLKAQLNHETGSAEAAKESEAAYDSINALVAKYNGLLGGKWNQMMSCVPPGFVAKYHLMPEVVSEPTKAFALPERQMYAECANRVDLASQKVRGAFRLIEGIGLDWTGLQMGEPHGKVQDASSLASDHIDISLDAISAKGADAPADSVVVCVSTVPFWPVTLDRSNRIGVSVDGCKPVVCENKFEEWSLPWKIQVLGNRKDYVLTLPLDAARKKHVLSLVVGDPGQIVQRISYEGRRKW